MSQLKKNPTLTPMMKQYFDIKSNHEDYLLFFRMGDFYELFFQDAIIASEALSITLTKRGQHNGDDIPMCGVPFHSADAYIARLIKQNFKIAICEQTEDPKEAKKRGYKAIVNRDVIRLITPGTLTEDNLLDPKLNNFICSLYKDENEFAITWLDASTGDVFAEQLSQDLLFHSIDRIAPKEIILPDSLIQETDLFELFRIWKKELTPLSDQSFHFDKSSEKLKKCYGVSSLDFLGSHISPTIIKSLGGLVDYLEITSKGNIPTLKPVKLHLKKSYVPVDSSTRKNLELFYRLNGEKKNSLIDCIDKTITAVGGRVLQQRLSMPLSDKIKIDNRLDDIEFFIENYELCQNIRLDLKKFGDLERCLARLSCERGGPRDLGVIRDSLRIVEQLSKTLSNISLPKGLTFSLKQISWDNLIKKRLEKVLSEDQLPFLAREGNFIKDNHMNELDECRKLSSEGMIVFQQLEENYRNLTGIQTLKIKHNLLLGYYLEGKANAFKELSDPKYNGLFIHKQTLANSVRFTTEEIETLQQKVLNAKEEAVQIEIAIFHTLIEEVLSYKKQLIAITQSIAHIDISCSMGVLATENQWIKPRLFDDNRLNIKNGRHPVVEKVVKQDNKSFIANNCKLDQTGYIWLITGPNMSGKSTFLRQNALIIILAQMGSYVPCEDAEIGIVDQIFSRVGASDDLAKGHSTFMVEMIETASILNHATDRSFVILDELGRGTATYDGLSLAWACVEFLALQIKARTLFATHYHEMTSLEKKISEVSCYTVGVKEWNDDIIFLHEIKKGHADKSYGLQVAKLAGIPKTLIERAKVILDSLESQTKQHRDEIKIDDLPLFSNTISEPSQPVLDENHAQLINLLKSIDINTLTPIEAMNTLNNLKKLTESL